jgi:membrane-bound inhibitor of C-type lysozyme
MATRYNYTGGIVTDGLVLNLDAAKVDSYPGTGTTWYDISGNNNNGTLTNGPTFSGIGKQASIVFDGVDDYIQCTGSLTLTSATFVTWIRRSGDQNQYDGILFSRGTNVTGMNFFSTNQLGYHWNDAIATFNWASGLTIPNLTWCMAAVSVSANSATAYLCQTSGITTATNTTDHTSSVLNNINIARDSTTSGGGNRYFNGNTAIAQIYNRALSATEITQNFNALRGRYGI